MAAVDHVLRTDRLDEDDLDNVTQRIAAIRSRVWVVDRLILMLHEIPTQSVFSLNLMFDCMEELAAAWPRFAYVVDLTDARRPTAEVRAELRRRVTKIR